MAVEYFCRSCEKKITAEQAGKVPGLSALVYSAFLGRCERCREKVGEAIAKAVKDYSYRLRTDGELSSHEISEMVKEFELKLAREEA